MLSIATARCACLLVLLGAGVASGQSTLPATSPTAAPKAAHPAQVVYSEGKLEVTADNSSLNQILRDVSRQTGMKITGAMIDERVFGKYGPSAPVEVLAKLLDGTSSNMILMETAAYAPAELILTPRQGGPTPPNPHARSADDDAASEAPQPSQAPTPPAPAPGVNPASRPLFSVGAAPNPSASPAAGGAADTGSADTSNPQSPNGVKTPQQIYQQLQQLQQQQQQANPK